MGVKADMRRRPIVLSIVLMLVAGLSMEALAAPSHKRFTASITPDEITAGTEGAFQLTVTNTSAHTDLGAVRMTVPEGFFDVGNIAVPGGWELEDQDPLLVVADGPHDRLDTGESLIISFQATTPLQDGDTEYTFEVEARQANKFRGKGNALRLVGGHPVVFVTGTAVSCSGLCTTNFSEATTSVTVSSECVGDDCILVTDLDQVCLLAESQCVGRSAFWVPPGGASDRVVVTITVPWARDPIPRFSVAFSDDGPVRECALVDSPSEGDSPPESDHKCVYAFEIVETDFGSAARIMAWVVPEDPRGFVS